MEIPGPVKPGRFLLIRRVDDQLCFANTPAAVRSLAHERFAALQAKTLQSSDDGDEVIRRREVTGRARAPASGRGLALSCLVATKAS